MKAVLLCALWLAAALPANAAEVDAASREAAPAFAAALDGFLRAPRPDLASVAGLLPEPGDPSAAADVQRAAAAFLENLPAAPTDADAVKLALLNHPLVWSQLGPLRKTAETRYANVFGRRSRAAAQMIDTAWSLWAKADIPAPPAVEEASPARPGGRASLASRLRLLDLPTTAPKAMTLRQLQAWRNDSYSRSIAFVRRDLLTEVRQLPEPLHGAVERFDRRFPRVSKALRLPKLLRPLHNHETGFFNYLMAAIALTLIAGLAIHLVSSAAGPMPILGFLGGAVTGDGIIWFVHRHADDIIEKHHAGEPTSAGKAAWLHHILPGDLAATELIRSLGWFLPGSILMGAVGLFMQAPGWIAFFLGLAVVGFVGQIFHRGTHFKDPGLWLWLLQKAGVATSPDYHDRHHFGETDDLLPGEDPVRNVGFYHLCLGYLSPIRLLDKIGLSDRLNQLEHALWREPMEWREYPHLKMIWTSPRRWRDEMKLAGRMARYRATTRWNREELAAAELTLATSSDLAERQEATQRAEELTALLGQMESGMTELRRRILDVRLRR